MILPSIVPQLRNSGSCVAGYNHRLPNMIESLYFDKTEQRFVLVKGSFTSGTLRMYMQDEQLPSIAPIPPDALKVTVAYDLNGQESVGYELNGVMHLCYFDVLDNAWVTRKYPDSTSLVVGTFTGFPSLQDKTVIVVAMTKPSKDSTDIVLLLSDDRFTQEHVYGKVSGITAKIRTIGMTPNNRFLIRFFNKVKVL